MDGPPAQSLGVEPVDPEIMKKPPRSRNSNILTRPLITRVLTAAFIVTVGTMFMYISEMADGVVTNKDATMVSLAYGHVCTAVSIVLMPLYIRLLRHLYSLTCLMRWHVDLKNNLSSLLASFPTRCLIWL